VDWGGVGGERGSVGRESTEIHQVHVSVRAPVCVCALAEQLNVCACIILSFMPVEDGERRGSLITSLAFLTGYLRLHCQCSSENGRVRTLKLKEHVYSRDGVVLTTHFDAGK
jgi:hypothetical protein